MKKQIKFKYITDELEEVEKTDGAITDIQIYINEEKAGELKLDYLSDEVMRDIIIEEMKEDNSISKKDKKSHENLKKFENIFKEEKEEITILIQNIKIYEKFRGKNYAKRLLNEAIDIIKKVNENNEKAYTYIVAAEIEKTSVLSKLNKLYSQMGYKNKIKEEKTTFFYDKISNIKKIPIKREKKKKILSH